MSQQSQAFDLVQQHSVSLRTETFALPPIIIIIIVFFFFFFEWSVKEKRISLGQEFSAVFSRISPSSPPVRLLSSAVHHLEIDMHARALADLSNLSAHDSSEPTTTIHCRCRIAVVEPDTEHVKGCRAKKHQTIFDGKMRGDTKHSHHGCFPFIGTAQHSTAQHEIWVVERSSYLLSSSCDKTCEIMLYLQALIRHHSRAISSDR